MNTPTVVRTPLETWIASVIKDSEEMDTTVPILTSVWKILAAVAKTKGKESVSTHQEATIVPVPTFTLAATARTTAPDATVLICTTIGDSPRMESMPLILPILSMACLPSLISLSTVI